MKIIRGYRCPHCQRIDGFDVIIDPDAPTGYKTCDYCKVSSPSNLIFYVEYVANEKQEFEMDSIFNDQELIDE